MACGDAAATRNISQEVTTTQRIPELVLILNTVRWIDNTAILNQLTELLHDQRQAKSFGFSGSPLKSVRVCDIALETLTTKPGIDIGIDPKTFHQEVQYSDAQLERAYKKLKRHFSH